MSTAIISDAELQRDVMAELKWEPSVDAAHIGVSVKDGVVTLSGHVSSYAEKFAAEEAAKRVHGVQAVVNEIGVKLPGSSERTDEDIAAAAVRVLKWNLLVPADKIKVTVSKGWVKLEGEVNWQFQKNAAEFTVRYLTGVMGVSNLIEVKPRVTPSELKTKIENALEAQRRSGRPPHHRRGGRRQGDPPRQSAFVGRTRGRRAGGLGGSRCRARRELHHGRAVTTSESRPTLPPALVSSTPTRECLPLDASRLPIRRTAGRSTEDKTSPRSRRDDSLSRRTRSFGLSSMT